MRIQDAAPAALAAAAIGTGIAGCGGGETNSASHHSADPTSNDALIQQDCNQQSYPLGEYLHASGQDIMVEPPAAKVVNGKLEFASKDENVTARDIAHKIARNTAALAIVYTIEQQTKTNIIAYDAVGEATSNWQRMENDPSVRHTVCTEVVGGILKAPHQYNYQSPTGKILVYAPTHGSAGLNGIVKPQAENGIGSNTTNNTGSIPGFNIAPVAGSDNYALQEAISHEWAITPSGAIIETAYQQGNARVSHHGKPVKANVHGQAPALTNRGEQPQQQQQPQPQQNAGGGAQGGGTVSPGRQPENLSGPLHGPSTGPHAGHRPEAHPGPGPTPQGGGRPPRVTRTTTTTTTAPRRTTETQTQTTTTQTPPPPETTTTTTTQTTTPPETTTTTTTSTSSTETKSPAPCDPNTGQVCNN